MISAVFIRHSRTLLSALFVLALAACEREDGIAYNKTVSVDQPNFFAQYINPVSALPSGDYTIVAANTSGALGDFTLTVNYDDGISEVYQGSWTLMAANDPTDVNNPAYDITIHTAGGLHITLESDTVDTYLYLLRSAPDTINDRSGPVFAENDDVDVMDTDSEIMLASSTIDSESFGKAYYDTIDPTDAKTTLEDWKMVNGYYDALAAGRVIEPRFRDTKDLGYGRGMRTWTDTDGNFYSFVENFQVRTVPGQEYTSINLDALINDVREHHFGSNAIEYSTYPYGTGEPSDIGSTHKFTKFFTFDATQGSQTMEDHANEFRLNTVNLDGRGFKAMPGACVYCHGGTIRPLRADGTYRDNCYDGGTCNGINGDTNAKLQLLEVPSFDYWPVSPHTRAEEEPRIKRVNMAIYCTYPGADPTACARAFCNNDPYTMGDILDPDGTFDENDCVGDGTNQPVPVLPVTASNGAWSGDFARQMSEGWYDDPTIGAGTADFDSDFYRDDYVPPGWDGDSDQEQLFLQVVQPICFVCHSRRGSDLGTNRSPGESKDIDFSTYAKFISHADQIKQYVFERGVMPLSLRGYNAFWEDPLKPIILANHINAALPGTADDIVFNSNNEVDQPSAVIADAGPDRNSPSPVRMFGGNSRFTDTFLWEIVSTPAGGGAAALDNAAAVRPVLTAPVDGDYVLRLTASNSTGDSDQDEVTIKIDSAITPLPADLTFVDHIKPIFDVPATIIDSSACTDCHADSTLHAADAPSSPITGVPVFWKDVQNDPGITFYDEVLARVDFNDPVNSLILTKPAGNHHYGNVRDGFEDGNPANRANYDMFLNWILEGARYSSTQMRE